MSCPTGGKASLELLLRRWAIRQLIKLADGAEERLHDWQVKLRNDLSDQGNRQHPLPAVHSSEDMLHQRMDDQHAERARPESETFLQWEARRSGVAPIAKKSRRRRLTAAEFDLRFAR